MSESGQTVVHHARRRYRAPIMSRVPPPPPAPAQRVVLIVRTKPGVTVEVNGTGHPDVTVTINKGQLILLNGVFVRT